ncbi:hypothetical protein HKD37_11G031082 [Glycine soja]
MILASGARGREFDSRNTPSLLITSHRSLLPTPHHRHPVLSLLAIGHLRVDCRNPWERGRKKIPSGRVWGWGPGGSWGRRRGARKYSPPGTNEEIDDLYNARDVVMKRMVKDEYFNMDDKKWDDIVEDGIKHSRV